MVTDMEVYKVADMWQLTCSKMKCIGPKLFDAKCTRVFYRSEALIKLDEFILQKYIREICKILQLLGFRQDCSGDVCSNHDAYQAMMVTM